MADPKNDPKSDPKSNRPKARLPRGLADRGPAEIAATRAMIETIRKVYELYGFEPVETPAFEYTDALGKFLPDQDRPNEGVFSFQDDDEQWLSLRYDLTAPLARYVAENFDQLPKPYRSYRAGYVYRNEKPGPGRFRQFMQFDADTVGSASPAADVEICMMAADTMEALGVPRGSYVVKVNNRKVLDGVMEAIGLGGEQNAGKRLTVLRAIDKYDRLGSAGVEALLGPGRKDESGDFTKGAGLSSDQIGAVMYIFAPPPTMESDQSNLPQWEIEDSLLHRPGIEADTNPRPITNRGTIIAARNRYPSNATYQQGLDELRQIADLAHAAKYGTRRILIDPSVVRGLEYYTGPVYEVELTFPVSGDDGKPVRFGSVGGGGRYDGLVARFRGEPVPATGFSIGVSRLQAALTHLGKVEARPEPGPVIVTVFDKDRVADYQRMASTLRQAGIRAELYLGSGKFGPQMKYADRRRSPCVVIQGPDEKLKGEVQIKDLIVGAELAGLSKERDDYLKKQAKAQFAVPEDRLVEAVAEVVARHGVTRRDSAGAIRPEAQGGTVPPEAMTLEKFISDLNSLAFFKEFTFSKNTFKPGAGGTEYELADNIVWIADDLTILQLKERSAEEADDASEARWFQNKVLGNATRQIRDTLKFLETNPTINVTNEHGHSFEIRGDQIRTKTKVVIYLPGKVVPDIAKTTRFYVSKTGGFIHVMEARDYLGICRTLRVPADIRDYFAYRQRLLESDTKLACPEPLIMGQYLSGDEKTGPSKDSYKYLTVLKQNFAEFDISTLLADLHRHIDHQPNPYAYYEILRQFARLPRSGWKETKTRLTYCIEAMQKREYRPPTRFAFKDLSLGFVFVPMDPNLMAEKNAVEMMNRGVVNFTRAHKYDQRLNSCVGLVMAKDGEEFLINWCVITHPWEYDAHLDAMLKERSPFRQVNERVISRFEFE